MRYAHPSTASPPAQLPPSAPPGVRRAIRGGMQLCGPIRHLPARHRPDAGSGASLRVGKPGQRRRARFWHARLLSCQGSGFPDVDPPPAPNECAEGNSHRRTPPGAVADIHSDERHVVADLHGHPGADWATWRRCRPGHTNDIVRDTVRHRRKRLHHGRLRAPVDVHRPPPSSSASA